MRCVHNAIFYLLWYNVIHWSNHTYKKSSFLSFNNLLFSVNNTGKVMSKTDKVWYRWREWKMPLCKLHTFWMAAWLICCFIVMFFYIERKWLLMRNIATILPLKSKFSGKFQCFSAIDGSIEMLKNSWISKNLNQNEKFQKIIWGPNSEPR